VSEADKQARHEEFVKYLESRTPQQIRQTMMEAGIIDESGELTDEYKKPVESVPDVGSTARERALENVQKLMDAKELPSAEAVVVADQDLRAALNTRGDDIHPIWVRWGFFVQERAKKFAVGDGVHWGFNGDTYPGTVVFVSEKGGYVLVSKDKYKIIDNEGGFVEGLRECVFTQVERPFKECERFTKGKDGVYRNAPQRRGGWVLRHGRAYSQNPSF
jgi:hypothetical protein